MPLPFGPHVPSFGPRPNRIAIVAEAPGESESSKLTPLVGLAGWELRRMLDAIGVPLDSCFRTNVFSRQTPDNDPSHFGTKSPSDFARSLGPLTIQPNTTWLSDEWLPELARLQAELVACRPNIIIALGNIACWALLGKQGISNLRGTVHLSDFIPDRPAVKVLPTYHPAAILRQWNWRTIAIADLAKAEIESHSPDLNFDNTELWLEPDLQDMLNFESLHMRRGRPIATDVETKRGQITCVSFAPSPSQSICVPFWREGPNPHYWPTEQAELRAWKWVRSWVEDPDTPLVMQNGLYDVQYFIRHGMKPRNCTEDTMLMHHSLYVEMQKGLGFLGSLYANVPSWKFMRTMKRDEVKEAKADD